MLDLANQTQYADWVVFPLLVPHPVAIRGTNVQEAFDNIKIRLPITLTVINTTIGSNTVSWDRTVSVPYVVTFSFTRIGEATTFLPAVVITDKFANSLSFKDPVGDNDLDMIIMPIGV